MGWVYEYYCERLRVTFKQGDALIVKGKGYQNSGPESPVGYDYTNDPTEKYFYGVYINEQYPEAVAYPICCQNANGSGRYFFTDASIYQNISGTVDTYTITYKANGGSGSDKTQKVTYGISWTSLGRTYTLTGHTQTSWNTRADGKGVTYSLGSEQTNTQLSNLTLYAIYTPNSYNLTVNPNGGTWNGLTLEQTFEQKYGTTKAIKNPTRIGYEFVGWELNGYGSLSGQTYTYGAGNGELVAQWNRIVLKVTFNASTNGGSPNSTRDVYYGDTIGSLPTPSKPFYKFIGWFTKAVGGAQVSSNNVITSNVTYYAQFKIDASVKVKYDGKKVPAIVWLKVNGVWKKCVTWIKDNGKWNKSSGAD